MGDKDVANGGDIVNGKAAVLTITAKPGYKLSEIKIDGKPANLPTGKFNSTDNTISYTYTDRRTDRFSHDKCRVHGEDEGDR